MDLPEIKLSRTARDRKHLNTLKPVTIRLRLFDPWGRPIPSAPYAVFVNNHKLRSGHADQHGDVSIRAPGSTAVCTVKWGRTEPGEEPPPPENDATDEQDGPTPPDRVEPTEDSGTTENVPSSQFEFEREVFLDVEGDDRDEDGAEEDGEEEDGDPQQATKPEAIRRRLSNMGYFRGGSLEQHVRAFQRDCRVSQTGNWNDVAQQILDYHDNKCRLPHRQPQTPPS